MSRVSCRLNPNGLEKIIPEKYQLDHGLTSGGGIEYLPSVDDVLTYLINTYLNGMVYGALTEAYASEQTARMTAMDNATENADEMLHKLTLKSNQARQAKITNELSEIVGGAEVLSQGGQQLKKWKVNEPNGYRICNSNHRPRPGYPVQGKRNCPALMKR